MRRWVAVLAVGAIVGCSGSKNESDLGARGVATIKVTCEAFHEGMPIAARHSGYLDNISPSMAWSNAPKETQAFAILVDDPDAPGSVPFTHWMVVNLPKDSSSVPDNVPKESKPNVLKGGIQGKNDFGETGYGGPKPEAGPTLHHYRFEVLAQDAVVSLQPGFDRAAFFAALKGHVIATGDTVGTYERPARR